MGGWLGCGLARLGPCLLAGVLAASAPKCTGAEPTAIVLGGASVPVEGVDPGEVLLRELGCLACHKADPKTQARLAPRPAPLLGEAAARVKPGFLRAWIADPWSHKPGGVMPDLLHGLAVDARETTVDALEHFLQSLAKRQLDAPMGANRVGTQQGRVLYHQLGCVACHAPREAATAIFADVPGGTTDHEMIRFVLGQLEGTSVPLGNLPRKYGLAQLTEFLMDPLRSRPGGRMPSMNLKPSEASALAMYLLRPESRPAADPSAAGGATLETGVARPHPSPLPQEREPATNASFESDPAGPRPGPLPQDGEPVSGTSIETGVVSSNSAPFVVDRRKAALGREEFARLGCAACHGLGPGRPSVAARSHAKPFGELDPGNPAGCLSPAPGAGVPLFRLNEAQRTALRTALASRARFRQPLTPKERVNQTLVGLNCVACHARDGVGGPTPSRSDYFSVLVAADLGDEGRIPPHLTGVGIKLRPEWSREVLLNAGSVRPYMATRMPQYGKANVAGLIDDFQRSDAAAASAQTSNSGAGDVQIGRLLVGVGGYSCISCHNFAQHASLGISVMDLTHMGKRLQPGWFFRYLADPASLRPGTRMPTFWPDGKSTNQEILGGDQARQIHSIWSYLTRGPKAGLPPGLAQAPAGGAGNRPSPGSDKSP